LNTFWNKKRPWFVAKSIEQGKNGAISARRSAPRFDLIRNPASKKIWE